MRVRAKAHIEEGKQGKDQIVVTELPYMVKKGGDGGVIRKIAELARTRRSSPRSRTSRTTRTAAACAS